MGSKVPTTPAGSHTITPSMIGKANSSKPADALLGFGDA